MAEPTLISTPHSLGALLDFKGKDTGGPDLWKPHNTIYYCSLVAEEALKNINHSSLTLTKKKKKSILNEKQMVFS